MKPLGQQVAEFMVERGLKPAAMAKLVGTNRQSIENLVKGSVALPSYIGKLADVMGKSADVLLGRRSAPPAPSAGTPIATPADRIRLQLEALGGMGELLQSTDERTRRDIGGLLSSFAEDPNASTLRRVGLLLADAIGAEVPPVAAASQQHQQVEATGANVVNGVFTQRNDSSLEYSEEQHRQRQAERRLGAADRRRTEQSE